MRVVLVAASAVFACRLLLALAVIPPWQQPDEPSHVALAELQRNRIALFDGSADPAREAEILQSMASYNFWEHRGRGIETPPVIPERFRSAGGRVAVEVVDIATPPTYHLIVGRVLGWLPHMSVVDDLYVLRAISAAFGMLTFWVAWLGARECLGPGGGAIVAVLLALHPQFAVVSTAASADAMVNLLGAGLWWQAATAVRQKRLLLPLAAVWLAAVAAASADRMGVPLLAVAFIVSVVLVTLRMPFRGLKALLAVPATAVLVAIMLGTVMWTIDERWNTYSLSWILSAGWTPVPRSVTSEFFVRFTSFVHQSWWSSLGWVRYPPPSWWAAVTIVLTAIATIGVGRHILRGRALDAQARTLLGLAVMSLSIQLSAVYWAFFRLGNGAQGKSLFPVLVPCLVLLWAGLAAWIPERRRPHAAVALVLVFAFLDAAVWTLVAIPAYYASP